jgi:hypothetical protein
MAQSTFSVATQAASGRIPRETGGILIGFRVGEDVYVADALEVMDDKSTGCRFVLRKEARENALDGYLYGAPPECPFGYVGSWHSHLADVGASGRDIKTLRQEAGKAHDLVAIIILRYSAEGLWTAEGAIGHRGSVRDYRHRWRPIVVMTDLLVRPDG